MSAWDRLHLSTVFFWLGLESETVWVGDEGVTESNGKTRRLGVEAQIRAELLPWLIADFDTTWVRAEFVNNPANANAIALAPDLLMSGGLTAQGFARVDASVGWEQDRFALSLQMLNLLNTKWRQAQFATTSRLPTEADASICPNGTRAVVEDGAFSGCEDINLTPAWPIHVQASATLKF